MEENWLFERIKDVPYKKKLYKFMKIFLFKWKGLTYMEMYALLKKLYAINIKDEETIKNRAMTEVLSIYMFNKNNGD